MSLRVSTTGSDVVLNDLGITVTHPTNNRDLSLEFTSVELRDSAELTAAIQSGDLEVDDGTFGIASDDYDPDELILQELGILGDTKYISNDELAAVGDTYIVSGIFPVNLSSTANSTRNVYAAAGRWKTWELEIGDLVLIEGNTAAGNYTVETVSDQQNFIVAETIPDSTGGTVKIYHPKATTRIGVDDSTMEHVEGDNLQEVLESIDDQLGGDITSGITPVTHRTLDQLVHNIAEDSWEEVTYSGIRPTSIIVWTDSGKTLKIREEEYVWNANKIDTITITQYDSDGLEEERIVETYTYSGMRVIEIDREYT